LQTVRTPKRLSTIQLTATISPFAGTAGLEPGVSIIMWNAPAEISAFLSIKYWSTGAIFGYLSDCAAAFGTSEPMLISSSRIVQPQAMMLIIFSLIILSDITLALVIFAFIFLSPMAALIAMSPFAAAARSPL
jgi:hypothetical protein